MRQVFLFLASTSVLAWPYLALAAGLVPCGGPGQSPCGACHIAQLILGVTEWLVLVLGIIATIYLVVAGLYLTVSVGNVSAMTWVKTSLRNLLIGYLFLAGGWFLIDTVLKFFLNDAAYGVWNEIQCL